MKAVVNEIVIGESVERVYGSCVDVERWPSIFASCRDVRQTPLGENEVEMEMLVSNDLGENRIRSHRRYAPERRRIDFEMRSLPPEIARMDGSWSVEDANGGGARLLVVHNFEPHDGADPDALADTLHGVTDRVLAQLKSYLEVGQRNALDEKTFTICELFFARMILAGLDWGDITTTLIDVRKASTFEDWDDWHRRWAALGDRYEQHAEEAGTRETRRECLLKAAAAHHFAEFMYFDEPVKKETTRVKVTDLFERAIPSLHEAVRPLRIPYGELELPGYLLTNPGAAAEPCVILVNGLDSAKEVELYAFARAFLARGMSAVLFDGPGQGLLNGKVPMVEDFEGVIGAVLDVVTEQPEVDAGRIGIFGVSFGGHLAPRAAAVDRRLQACISLSGGFDHDNYRAINVMVRKDFRYVFGARDDDEMEQICRESLNLRSVPPLRRPLLAVHSEHDSLIPFGSCLRLLDWAEGEKTLLRYPGRRHVATNHMGDFVPRFGDWMAERLDACAPGS